MPLPEVAPVCDGGQLELNCTITGSLLEWRITPEQNLSQLSPQTFVSRRNHDQSVQYGGSTITFTIISHPMHLTSRILISPVYNNLDGIKVECRDAADQQSSSSTFISVVSAQGIVEYPIAILSHIIMLDFCHFWQILISSRQ